jgi:hypothetical protein
MSLIGTIVPWISQITGVPALSSDWVLCNGQTLNDPSSPYHNQVIPNLNGIRFLMGSTTSNTTGGASTFNHTHQLGAFLGNWGFPSGEPGVSTANWATPTSGSSGTGGGDIRPPFYKVRYIMKIK